MPAPTQFYSKKCVTECHPNENFKVETDNPNIAFSFECHNWVSEYLNSVASSNGNHIQS